MMTSRRKTAAEASSTRVKEREGERARNDEIRLCNFNFSTLVSN